MYDIGETAAEIRAELSCTRRFYSRCRGLDLAILYKVLTLQSCSVVLVKRSAPLCCTGVWESSRSFRGVRVHATISDKRNEIQLRTNLGCQEYLGLDEECCTDDRHLTAYLTFSAYNVILDRCSCHCPRPPRSRRNRHLRSCGHPRR